MLNKEFENKLLNSLENGFERETVVLYLKALPEGLESRFEAFYSNLEKNAALDPIQRATIALVNSFDDDIISVTKETFRDEVTNQLFDKNEIDYEDYAQYFDFYEMVMDKENEYEPETEDSPETYAEYLQEEYNASFDPEDTDEYALYILNNGEVHARNYFNPNQYVNAIIRGDEVFGPEVYLYNGEVYVTPNLNFELAISLLDRIEQIQEEYQGKPFPEKEMGAAIREELTEVLKHYKINDREIPQFESADKCSLDSLIKEAENEVSRQDNTREHTLAHSKNVDAR